MNDIVSIRKIRPLPGAAAGRGPGAALPCGEDFFLAGNEPSLTVMEFLTTKGIKEYSRLLLQFEHVSISKCVFAPVFPCVLCSEDSGQERIIWSLSARHTEG